jgi:CRISPR-associated protein Csx3
MKGLKQMFYNISLDGDVLRVGFGAQAPNDTIVKEVSVTLKDMSLPGGPLLRINGPASLPVAVAITHAVAHLYGAVAVWDPKLSKYVVSVSHNPDYMVGELVD